MLYTYIIYTGIGKYCTLVLGLFPVILYTGMEITCCIAYVYFAHMYRDHIIPNCMGIGYVYILIRCN